MENLPLVILGIITKVSIEPDWVPVLIHCVHMLPSIGVLEEGIIVTITVRSWLVAVDLSLPEEISVVVASLACLHLLSHTLSSFNWI